MKTLVAFLLIVAAGTSPAQIDSLKSKTKVDLENFVQRATDPSEYSDYGFLDSIEAFEIEYENEGHLIRGYLFEPKSEGPHPLILFNRGGNRDFASLNLGMMISYTARLAADGFVILASNYRDADEFGGRDIEDVLKLLDISATIETVDNSRIGMLGWSRGGMMAYLAMSKTDRLKTVVVGNGPTDLEQTLIERPGLEAKVFEQCIPNYQRNKTLELRKRSVLHWPDKLNTQTSLLILAGTKDRHVSYRQAEQLAKQLKQTEIDFSLMLFETDHFFSDMKKELHEALLNWFNAELKE